MPYQATQIIAVSERAPFGRGPETVFDLAVRSTWQLPASMVTLGDEWNRKIIPELVSHACYDMGVDETALGVQANLYKLLLYEPGDHFISHTDTEKEPGMFGSLVMQLPSEHTGGKLVVSHKGVTKDFSSDEASDVYCHFTAFYADCVHAIEPVTSGHRLALAYNLVRTKDLPSPQVKESATVIDTLVEVLKRWRTTENAPKSLAYKLDHK